MVHVGKGLRANLVEISINWSLELAQAIELPSGELFQRLNKKETKKNTFTIKEKAENGKTKRFKMRHKYNII